MNFPKIFGACLFFLAAALMVEISGTTDLRVVERILETPKVKKTSKKEETSPLATPNAIAPGEEKRTAQRVPKSPQVIAQDIDLLCRDFNSRFNENKIDNRFSRVDFKFHEKRLRSMKFRDHLKKCFVNLSAAKNRIELDIFSADFAGENASDLIGVQVSVFDKKSKNKIFETGAKFDLSSAIELPTKAEAPGN